MRTQGISNSTIEWPTILLIVVVYLSFFIITYFAGSISLWLSVPLLAIVIAQHSSLQHEILHGHPFQNQRVSDLIGSLAIGGLIPYLRFKQTHLQHHIDPQLTDPYDDPETNFLDPEDWNNMGLIQRALLQFNNTLLGRTILGPALSLWHLVIGDLRSVFAGDRNVRYAWIFHIFGFLPVMYWLVEFAALPLWAYFIAAYSGLSLLKIRTFLEHRAHLKSGARSVIINDRGPLALLFLNNNLHSVHHIYPKVAWYRLPALYESRKHEFHRRNSGYYFKNYFEVLKKYFVTVKDPILHPLRKGPSNITQKPMPGPIGSFDCSMLRDRSQNPAGLDSPH